MARRFQHIQAANLEVTGETIAIAAHVTMLIEAREMTVIAPTAMMTSTTVTAMNGSAAKICGDVFLNASVKIWIMFNRVLSRSAPISTGSRELGRNWMNCRVS